jgi:hypothetical protein
VAGDINVAAQSAEGSAVRAMTVRGCMYVLTGLVDSSVDRKAGGIVWGRPQLGPCEVKGLTNLPVARSTPFKYVAVMVDQQQVRDLHKLESNAIWVDPEGTAACSAQDVHATNP